MLSDPKDDIVQSSEAGGEGKKEKEKGQAELLSSQIAQLHMKAAPVSTSPHVQGANSTHMGDFGAESGIKASLGGEMASFGTSNSFDGKSMFHGTNALDTITTTVLAAPLEDSDGLADFLPDLSQRMEQLDNCLDAQDNVDNMGLVEQEDRGMYMSSTRGQGPPPHVHQLPQYEQSVLEGKEERKETHSDDAEGVNSAAASAADVDEPPTHPCDASRYDTGTTLAASELRHRRGGAPAPTPASAVIVSRIDSDRLGTPVSDANSATAARISEDVAMDGSLCEQQCHLSVQYGSSDDKSTLSSVQRTPVSTQDAQEQAQERQDQHQLPQEDPGEEEKGEVDEEERVRQAAAQQEFEQARARLVDRLQGVDRALAAAVERIAQAEDMLVENLEQQGVVGGAGGGAAAGLFRAEEGGGAERDVVDEWLTIVLIALGTSIALMTWRIALRYYSLFFF